MQRKKLRCICAASLLADKNSFSGIDIARFQIKPRFEIKENSITVILPVLSATVSVASDGNRVLELLSGEMRYSSSEIAGKLNWSKDKTIRILNVLVEAGYVRKTGTGRGTKYYRG